MRLPRPPRVLVSKIGLDGHDRGAKLIVRNLRDAGMEVIYTGLWQTPAATVHAALQEDAEVLGVSLLSAAHMTIMPEVLAECRRVGLGDLPVVVGGIIPEQDKEPLRDMGCAAVFNPGSPTSAILDAVRSLAARRRAARDAAPAPDVSTPMGLARALTLVTEGRAAEVPSPKGPPDAAPPTARRVGVTGPPGVGKSTFIGRLAQALRRRGLRVAVVAVDPTSPVTGGALLGDRLRMMTAAPDEGVFVRSLSSGGTAGGLAPHADAAVELLLRAGFEIVLIETVGAGQNDVEVRRVADEVLLLLMPGAGDSIQFEKAGILEIATGFVVNKSDLAGADLTIRDLRDAVHDERPIWSVSALRGEGFDALVDWVASRPTEPG